MGKRNKLLQERGTSRSSADKGAPINGVRPLRNRGIKAARIQARRERAYARGGTKPKGE